MPCLHRFAYIRPARVKLPLNPTQEGKDFQELKDYKILKAAGSSPFVEIRNGTACWNHGMLESRRAVLAIGNWRDPQRQRGIGQTDLDCLATPFTGTNANAIIQGEDEDFAIPNFTLLAGSSSLYDCLNRRFDEMIIDSNL